jgi:hypothetical protein
MTRRQARKQALAYIRAIEDFCGQRMPRKSKRRILREAAQKASAS